MKESLKKLNDTFLNPEIVVKYENDFLNFYNRKTKIMFYQWKIETVKDFIKMLSRCFGKKWFNLSVFWQCLALIEKNKGWDEFKNLG